METAVLGSSAEVSVHGSGSSVGEVCAHIVVGLRFAIDSTQRLAVKCCRLLLDSQRCGSDEHHAGVAAILHWGSNSLRVAVDSMFLKTGTSTALDMDAVYQLCATVLRDLRPVLLGTDRVVLERVDFDSPEMSHGLSPSLLRSLNATLSIMIQSRWPSIAVNICQMERDLGSSAAVSSPSDKRIGWPKHMVDASMANPSQYDLTVVTGLFMLITGSCLPTASSKRISWLKLEKWHSEEFESEVDASAVVVGSEAASAVADGSNPSEHNTQPKDSGEQPLLPGIGQNGTVVSAQPGTTGVSAPTSSDGTSGSVSTSQEAPLAESNPASAVSIAMGSSAVGTERTAATSQQTETGTVGNAVAEGHSIAPQAPPLPGAPNGVADGGVVANSTAISTSNVEVGIPAMSATLNSDITPVVQTELSKTINVAEAPVSAPNTSAGEMTTLSNTSTLGMGDNAATVGLGVPAVRTTSSTLSGTDASSSAFSAPYGSLTQAMATDSDINMTDA